jgi:hypothetical protein
MAAEKKIKGISKINSGFPEYLDFNKLRSESIEYLGQLSGKIWTDHNVHDPGITILEMLCYALLDLGYRTNLPVEDILTADPSYKGKDNNFFTPARILGNNPLTITDYRKLLVDIEGVRNAWLEPATDITNICDINKPTDRCVDFLNGLYHVYLDTEKVDTAKQPAFDLAVVERVKEALMAHRNLCEDFADIYVLCKLEMGVCVEIELNDAIEAEKVYVPVVEKLRNFFTPSPRYYTLQQLLDKHKNIEDIFAGRPIGLTQSHGFIDTEEFEQLTLRKEIHLSDVYTELFSVPGVKAVKNLGLRKCGDSSATNKWKIPLPENHVLEFSPACSGFRFTRNGLPLHVDAKKFETLFQLNFDQRGKILYHTPSPYLDSEIPKGVYRSDLSEYFSIQNEFPRVYGISEGGLPESSSTVRKAQALQLKGYLLFFDQLLANYLSQLQNIRTLFSLSSAEEKEKQHTYFINEVRSVPDMNKLLRFGADGTLEEDLGSAGTVLVFPVSKADLLLLKEQATIPSDALENFPFYTFDSVSHQSVTIQQVKDDLYNEAFLYDHIETSNGGIYYYLLTAADDIALLSRKPFDSLEAAAQHVSAVKYIASFDENYRTFLTSGNKFSFAIELNISSFSSYLQLITEDDDLYVKRRSQFLDHLLARFSEKFTDFALLSFQASSQQSLREKEIKAKENFLQHYDDISSNRGKGYDYLKNGWNNDNLSGFEKKVKAYLGLDTWKKNSLCNFVVEQYDEQYIVKLSIGAERVSTLSQQFESREDAHRVAREAFLRMADPSYYYIDKLSHLESFAIKVRNADHSTSTFTKTYRTETEARSVIANLSSIIAGKTEEDEVFPSQFIYKYHLEDSGKKLIRTSSDFYTTADDATSGSVKMIKYINDKKRWETQKEINQPGTLHYDQLTPGVIQFIDLDAFKLDINNTIVGKPDKFFYEVLDVKHRFKFVPVREFDTSALAEKHCHELLTWMLTPSNYRIIENPESKKFELHIVVNESDEALCVSLFSSRSAAADMQNAILGIVNEHRYTLSVKEAPYRWKLRYHLGYDPSDRLTFESVTEYEQSDAAYKDASEVKHHLHDLRIKNEKGAWYLTSADKKISIPSLKLAKSPYTEDKEIHDSANRLKQFHEAILNYNLSTAPESFSASVDIDEISKLGRFVYRLVDKDTIPARYNESFVNPAQADARRKQLARIKCVEYRYPEICFGKESIERYVSGKNVWYHYAILLRNHSASSGKETAFFKSVKGYATEEEAMKALKEKYLTILMLASDEKNYGEVIRLEEFRVHAADTCHRSDSIAFIPKETLAAFGGYDEAAAKNIIKVAQSYPIRKTVYGSPDFNAAFPCDAVSKKLPVKCDEPEERSVYYFRLPDPHTAGNSWQSKSFYESAEEATNAFLHFANLLCFPGNLYVGCDECDPKGPLYRIYIREILAESATRFLNESEAWGKDGIQKFICTTQVSNSFFHYQGKDDCCYSFYVACPEGTLFHPCKYDTRKQRDESIDRLFKGINSFLSNQSFSYSNEKDAIVLSDINGKAFARILSHTKKDECEIITAFTKTVMGNSLVLEQKGDKIFGTDKANQFTVESYTAGTTLEEWKSALEEFACFFPIIPDETNGKTGKYAIEIKLPGFALCQEDPITTKGCGCPDKVPKPEPACHVAWRSKCSYNSCREAFESLRNFLPLLREYANYQPVFDCACNSFGIALHYRRKLLPDPATNQPRVNNRMYTGEMVAYNPQCYSHATAACDAAARTLSLINAEGLHIVEHILLRPRCPEDCACNEYREGCESKTDCSFTWKEQQEDPCLETTEVCFVPGADRFSFIATIALPAWPQRFRSSENRLLVEKLLHREAPAHVLLRILWLAPHDFCCFEKKYKGWNKWLAKKQSCGDNFSTCDFLHFLFQRNYACLEDCQECVPCEQDQETKDTCFSRIAQNKIEPSFLEQVNSLFCWHVNNCDAYQFIDCETRVITTPGITVGANTVASLPAPAKVASRAVKKLPKEEKSTKQEITPPQELQKDDLRERIKWINSRSAGYKASVHEILKKSREHVFARKVLSFLNDPSPDQERISHLLEELITTGKNKKAGNLSKKQLQELCQCIVCSYLDKVTFSGKDPAKIQALGNDIRKLKENKLDTRSILKRWKPEEVSSHTPGIPVKQVTRIFELN